MSVWSKIYERINWKDLPQRLTALAARNLNKMDLAIDTIDDRVIALDNGKVSSVTVTNTLPDGDTIATITVDGTPTAIKSKQPNEQEMNVRSAMLLLSPTPIGENAPFVKRRSGGNVPFPALLKDKIIGASVVWNQMVKNGNFVSTDNWTSVGTFSVANNKATLSADGSMSNVSIRQSSFSLSNGHKYLITGTITSSVAITSRLRLYKSGEIDIKVDSELTANNRTIISLIISLNNDYSGVTLYVYPANSGKYNGTATIENVMLFDLTAMFGSTIADYVNTLETQTAGSGIAWLKSYGFFTEPYYAYSANKIESVSVSAKKYVGKNKLQNTATSTTINGVTFTVNSDGSVRAKGTASGNAIFVINSFSFDGTSVILNGCPTGGSGSTYKLDAFGSSGLSEDIGNGVTISTSGERNVRIVVFSGTTIDKVFYPMIRYADTPSNYVPYQKWQTALDHTTLRGLLKLDANNNLYADGDIYPSDGTESVVYDEFTFTDDMNWTYYTAGTNPIFYANIPNAITYSSGDEVQALNELYPIGKESNSRASLSANLPDKTCSWIYNGGAFVIRDSSYTSADAFKTAMTGKKMIIKKYTPTTQNLTPYPELQNIASGGTEEFVDYQVSQGNRDVSIPVGGDRQYYQGMEIPALPTASGNHNLQFNPSSGFSWS